MDFNSSPEDFSSLTEYILGDESYSSILEKDERSRRSASFPRNEINRRRRVKRCREVYNLNEEQAETKKKIDKNKINRTFFYYSIEDHSKKNIIRDNVVRCLPGPSIDKSVAILNKSNNLMLLELSDRLDGSYYANSANYTDQLIVIENSNLSRSFSGPPCNIFGSLVKQRIHKTLLPKIHIVERKNDRFTNFDSVYTTTNFNLTKQHMIKYHLSYSGYLVYAYGSEDFVQKSVYNRWDGETISIILYSIYLFILDVLNHHINLCNTRSVNKMIFVQNMDFFLDMFFDQVDVVRNSIFIDQKQDDQKRKNRIHCAGVINNFNLNQNTRENLFREYSQVITGSLASKFKVGIVSVSTLDFLNFVDNDRLWRHGINNTTTMYFETLSNLVSGLYTFIFFCPYLNEYRNDVPCLTQVIEESYVVYTRVE